MNDSTIQRRGEMENARTICGRRAPLYRNAGPPFPPVCRETARGLNRPRELG